MQKSGNNHKSKMHDEVLVFYIITRFKYLNMDLLVELWAISESKSCNMTCYFSCF